MNLIFVGSVYPKFLLDYLLSKGVGADFAANNFQSALLDGFSNFYDNILVVTSPSINNIKDCDDNMLKKRTLSLSNPCKGELHYVGSIKCRLLRLFSELFRVRKTVRKILSSKKSDNTVCCYALHSPFLVALLSLKRKINKVCVIVPDLPEFMGGSGGFMRRVAKKIDRKIINFCVRRLDCYVLLSDAMVGQIPIKDKEWVLVEGIYSHIDITAVQRCSNTTLLYTGQLQKRYGVFDLVEAFILIPNEDFELWLVGGSTTEEMCWLENKARNDSRIKLLGKVSPVEARLLQKKATLLVNPRHSNEEFTKYSFPSKTMEYLASGTPTIMCKLPSIPEEYYEHLFFFDDESVVGMKEKIIEVCSMDKNYLIKKGEDASKFIKTKKNAKQQVEKIVKMLQSS